MLVDIFIEWSIRKGLLTKKEVWYMYILVR
jgi:hypothetical protein